MIFFSTFVIGRSSFGDFAFITSVASTTFAASTASVTIAFVATAVVVTRSVHGHRLPSDFIFATSTGLIYER